MLQAGGRKDNHWEGLTPLARIVIVGGVAGGMSAAARLRRLDESAEIIVFERGPFVSFANCGLPYYASGVIPERDELIVEDAPSLRAQLLLDIRTETNVVSINRTAKTIAVEDTNRQRSEEAYDTLILSPGAAAVRPPIPGVDDSRIHTIRSIPDIDALKSRLDTGKLREAVVVGGGFIGVEMADNLLRANVKVHLVEMTNQVLSNMLDPDMAAFAHAHLRSKGLHLHFGSAVHEFVDHDGQLAVVLSNGSYLKADAVILAIGVRPEVNLAVAAGLALGLRGGIAVDEYLRTSDPHIYAIGDAIEARDVVTGSQTLVALASPANKQGRLVADNIYGRRVPYKGTQGTAIVDALGMVAAGTGATSAALKRAGLPHLASVIHAYSNAAYFPGATPLTIKLLFDQKGRILGAQVVGEKGVDKRIDVLATALRLGATVYDLQELELAYAPQFGSAKDPVNIAGYVAGNILAGDVTTVQATQVPDLENIATFLDVREPEEHARGSIPGSLNIPLAQLRERLSEIPRGKPVVVYCQVGRRAYIACRALRQLGLDVANLAGGWRSYAALKSEESRAMSLTH
jgi:NADPH-dependent 2,4-dienoyl-CoA reductase/sulfur reductase-like enzyme/rhodanese-related sulfurtransferase